MKYDIFLSYSREDFEYGDVLSERFSSNGFTVFFDRKDLQGGQDFANIISSAIDSCNVVLYLYSQNSEQSRWVQNEINYAVSLNKQIIVLNIGAQLNETLFSRQAELSKCEIINVKDFSEEELERVVETVLSSLKGGAHKRVAICNEKHTFRQDKSETQLQQNKLGNKTLPKVGCFKITLLLFFVTLLSLILVLFLTITSSPDYEVDGGSSPTTIGCADSDCLDSPSPPNYEWMTGNPPTTLDSANSASLDSIDKMDDVKNDEYSYIDTIANDSIIIEDDPTEAIVPAVMISRDEVPGASSVISINLIILGIIILIVILVLVYISTHKKYHLKIHNRSNKQELSLLVDGKFEANIKPLEVLHIQRKKGEYILTIKTDNIVVDNIHYKFDYKHNNKILPIQLKENLDKDLITYRCFIGGSTSIVNERNAARSVLSILYNQYDKYNFYITAHTFEDFKNKHKIEGHQYEYDEFIKNKANCAIFIICNYVGEKTLDEYKVAIETFESTKEERPTIFVYNDISDGIQRQDESVVKFRNFVDSKKAYWRDYKDIETLMLKMKDDISAELADVLEMKPNLMKLRK